MNSSLHVMFPRYSRQPDGSFSPCWQCSGVSGLSDTLHTALYIFISSLFSCFGVSEQTHPHYSLLFDLITYSLFSQWMQVFIWFYLSVAHHYLFLFSLICYYPVTYFLLRSINCKQHMYREWMMKQKIHSLLELALQCLFSIKCITKLKYKVWSKKWIITQYVQKTKYNYFHRKVIKPLSKLDFLILSLTNTQNTYNIVIA